MRVAMFPPAPSESDAYVALLSESLRQAGAQVVDSSRLDVDWVRRVAGGLDAIHLHWIEYVLPIETSGALAWLKTARRGLRCERALRLARRNGIRVVWTIHNLRPHEPRFPRLEEWMIRRMLGLVDVAIVHSEYARRRVAETYGETGKLRVIPHGNYVGVYPHSSSSRRELRQSFGLEEDDCVFLAFGQIRRYKLLPDLIAAIGDVDPPAKRLVIAGTPVDAKESNRVRQLAASRPEVTLELRHIPKSDVQAWHRAADIAIFAYEYLFSSGAAVLALSLGLPIIVPADSTGAELGEAPAVECIGPDGLAAAMDRAALQDRVSAGESALRAAEAFPWSEVARRTLSAYEAGSIQD